MSQIELERFELRLSGTGGQGILTLGKVLGHALAMQHGYNVTLTQSYGPEARGGASRADLVVSSKPISYPKPEHLDLLVALSQEACNLYYRNLKHDGILLLDTSSGVQAPTNQYWGIPFTNLAKEKIGMVQTTNFMVLGALSHLLAFGTQKTFREALEENVAPKIKEINVKAFLLGHAQAKKLYPDAKEQWKFS